VNRPPLTLLALLVLTSPAAVRAADPPKPAHPFLAEMAGTWDDTITNKPSVWLPEAATQTAVTTKTLTLGGRVVRSEGTIAPADVQFLALLAYDPQAKEFRNWYFDAAGTFPRGTTKGTWDDRTKTITWAGTDEDGNKSAGTTRVVDKDTHEWTLTVTDPAGKVLLDMRGKNARRKP
jgi:hypothetical protein